MFLSINFFKHPLSALSHLLLSLEKQYRVFTGWFLIKLNLQCRNFNLGDHSYVSKQG